MKTRIKQLLMIFREVRNPVSYFSDYFKLKKGIFILKLRNNLKFKLRAETMDRGAVNESSIYKLYNPKGFEINSEDIVIDIGAI